eukprot:6207188-Pleurochrysis_carterae.AAC.3
MYCNSFWRKLYAVEPCLPRGRRVKTATIALGVANIWRRFTPNAEDFDVRRSCELSGADVCTSNHQRRTGECNEFTNLQGQWLLPDRNTHQFVTINCLSVKAILPNTTTCLSVKSEASSNHQQCHACRFRAVDATDSCIACAGLCAQLQRPSGPGGKAQNFIQYNYVRSGGGRGCKGWTRLRGGSGSGARFRQFRPCARGDPELEERSAERFARTHAARVQNRILRMRAKRSSARRRFQI